MTDLDGGDIKYKLTTHWTNASSSTNKRYSAKKKKKRKKKNTLCNH